MQCSIRELSVSGLHCRLSITIGVCLSTWRPELCHWKSWKSLWGWEINKKTIRATGQTLYAYQNRLFETSVRALVSSRIATDMARQANRYSWWPKNSDHKKKNLQTPELQIRNTLWEAGAHVSTIVHKQNYRGYATRCKPLISLYRMIQDGQVTVCYEIHQISSHFKVTKGTNLWNKQERKMAAVQAWQREQSPQKILSLMIYMDHRLQAVFACKWFPMQPTTVLLHGETKPRW